MLQVIEISIVLGLIAWQALVYRSNYRLIRQVTVMYPAKQALGIEPKPAYDAVDVSNPSKQFARIKDDTNDYLQANKGAAASFDTLRDISEREANLLDEEIQAQISTPLYLGLLGTFAGAIIGLISLLFVPDHVNPAQAEVIRKVYQKGIAAKPQSARNLAYDSVRFYAYINTSVGNQAQIHNGLTDSKYKVKPDFKEFRKDLSDKAASFDNEAINRFLLGILIAMGGSIVGLGLTLAGNQQLKAARATRDRLKNSYYNFLQKALLPRLNSDMQQSMSSLKAVLDTFNQDFFSKIQANFFTKIAEFTPLVGAITENITVQRDFLAKLQTIGYTQLANSTIKVFDRVDASAATFEKFLGYQEVLNTTLSHGADAALTITALLNRLTNLEKSLNTIPGYLEQYQASISSQAEFFKQHQELLDRISRGVTIALNEDAEKMREVIKLRRKQLEDEATAAHAEWSAHFQRLNENNIYQRITDYLNPFQQLPAQQQQLNRLQEEQARRSAAALTALQQRIERDEQVQRELLTQLDRTNAVLEKMTEPSWFQRTILGKKGRAPR